MHRISQRILLLISALFVFFTSTALAQTFTHRQIGTHLYLMNQANDSVPYMNNVVLLGNDGVLLVDTTDAGKYSAFRAGLDQISTDPVRKLINTHWHHDHTGLNADFVINEGTSSILAHFRTGPLLAQEQYFTDLESTAPALPPEAQPTEDIYFGKFLFQSGEAVLLLPTPPNAHSNTDLVVFFLTSNVIYFGDIYFGGAFPFIDRDRGGSIEGMIRACRLILPLTNCKTLLVPSHGPTGDRRDLEQYLEMLELVRDRIQALVDQGLSEEGAVAEQPLVDLDQRWGKFFVNAEQFTRLVYRDLAQ